MTTNIPQLNGMKSKELLTAFRAWVGRQDAGETGTWFAGLDEGGQESVTREMASFCEDAGFDLAWVVQAQVENATLKAALDDVVLHNLQAFHHASVIQPTLTLYKTTVAWLQKPTARKYRDDTRKIYTHLVQKGIIPPASADALLDTNKNRWQHVTDALHAAYRSDPSAVEHAVGTVMLAEEETVEESGSARSWWPFGGNQEPEPAAA